jgi:hypothetical protein
VSWSPAFTAVRPSLTPIVSDGTDPGGMCDAPFGTPALAVAVTGFVGAT